MEDSLLTSTVPRSLDTKSKILGLELGDVLILLFNLSVENLIFGETSFRLPMVFGTSALLFGLLFFVKRGKPDGYLQHFFEHLVSPTVFSANTTDEEYRVFAGDSNAVDFESSNDVDFASSVAGDPYE